MGKPETGSGKRRGFYDKAVHILFAIVLAHSFLLASDALIPISEAFEPARLATTATLMFSYLLIVSGWVGYARSVSVRPHKDTGWGVARFVLDIAIIFEYFYVLQISQTGHAGEIPYALAVIFGTYIVHDCVKSIEHETGMWEQIKHLERPTMAVSALVLIAVLAYDSGSHDELAESLGTDGQMLVVIHLAGLVALHRVAKWNPDTRRRRQSGA